MCFFICVIAFACVRACLQSCTKVTSYQNLQNSLNSSKIRINLVFRDNSKHSRPRISTLAPHTPTHSRTLPLHRQMRVTYVIAVMLAGLGFATPEPSSQRRPSRCQASVRYVDKVRTLIKEVSGREKAVEVYGQCWR